MSNAPTRTQPSFSDFGHRVRRAYILALCLVGVLSVCAFVVLNGFIAQQGDAASVINVAGKQRMLSQRIAGLSRALVQPTGGTAPSRDRALLESAVRDMASAHEGLTLGDAARNLPGIRSDAERAYYFDDPHHVDASVRAFVADARGLLGARDARDRAAFSERISESARIELLGALNAVVGFHETRARADASRAERLHLGILITTIGTLFCEAWWVFAPLARALVSKEKAVRDVQTELTHKSLHDQLTGLFNRHYLQGYAKARHDVPQGMGPAAYSLIAIDLDNFKNVNDARGHEAGDRLLRIVADLLLANVRENDRAFRIGGDEFLVAIDSADPAFAPDIAERLRTGIRNVLAEEPGCSFVGASFGIASAPADGASLEEVHANADIALYHAKSTGKNTAVVFHEALRSEFRDRRTAETFVRNALDADAFEPFFQPQVNMRTGEIVGVEALARCRADDGTIVSPGEFLAVAEATGLIVPIGERLIAKAIRIAASWRSEGAHFGKLSVNASSAQLRDAGFVDFLASTLAQSGLPSDCLSVEILETVLIDEDDTIVRVVEAIQALGISVELDDFGTGHTSIANVDRLKVDRIKIDRSFVDGLGRIDSKAHVLNAILTMARSLGVKVIAEGIETDQQQRQLIKFGCPDGQGFLFARPMCEQDMLTLLRAEPEREMPIRLAS